MKGSKKKDRWYLGLFVRGQPRCLDIRQRLKKLGHPSNISNISKGINKLRSNVQQERKPGRRSEGEKGGRIF